MTDDSLGDADYYDSAQYASLGCRLLVMVIDVFMLLVIGVVLWAPFFILIISGIINRDPSGYFWLLYLISIWVYLVPVKRSSFGTVGFRLLGVTLVSTKGGKPSLLNMTMRMVLWLIGPFHFIFLYLIYSGLARTRNGSLFAIVIWVHTWSNVARHPLAGRRFI